MTGLTWKALTWPGILKSPTSSLTIPATTSQLTVPKSLTPDTSLLKIPAPPKTITPTTFAFSFPHKNGADFTLPASPGSSLLVRQAGKQLTESEVITTMQIVAQWAGHFYDPAENSDKIWAGAYTDTGDYIAVWGRRGNRKYQSQTKQFGSAALAHFEFGKMVSQKERKGYHNVPFEDTNFGNIPSFKHTLTGNARTGIGKITGGNLLERIRQLVQRMGASFEPDTVLVEFGQLRAACGLVLEYADRKNSNAISHSPDEDFVPGELEAALEELRLCVKQALLA